MPEDRKQPRTVSFGVRSLEKEGAMPPPTAHMGIYIDRPVQDVFEYVMDIGRTPEWRPRMWAPSGARQGRRASAASSG